MEMRYKVHKVIGGDKNWTVWCYETSSVEQVIKKSDVGKQRDKR